MGQARRSEKTRGDQVKWIVPVEAAVAAADYIGRGRHARHYSRQHPRTLCG
jgi:hypothetical protein